MDSDVAYISASTNRYTQTADVSPSSLVAFGSSNLIALWDTTDEAARGIYETLPGHEGSVTCVRFVSNTCFVSADDKGVLRCWRFIESQWISTAKVQAHPKAVSSLCVHKNCLATGSSDAFVKIWTIVTTAESDELKESQILPLHGKYPLALALSCLPQSKAIILAIAGTDRNVQIWTRSEDLFVRSAVLSGHEDWVRSLAFRVSSSEADSLTLASGSQDSTIRLWDIEVFNKDISALQRNQPGEALSDELLDAFEASLGDLADAEEGGRQISLKRHILTVKSAQGSSQQYSITFDALLIGHEAGVTSLSWRPAVSSNPIPTLLSTSTDSSVIMWSPATVLTSSQDGSTSIWINRQRFGDIGGQRLGGFVGGVWARDGDEALAWGWSGGWRRWRCNRQSPSKNESDEVWNEVGAIGGHNGPVKSLDWSPQGEFLISAGLDQTTRIHAGVPTSSGPVWQELNRPQIHGYDLLGVAFLGPLKFISIADEKVARVFEAPRGFVDLVESLNIAKFAANEHDRPLGASVPPLGLSNKAVIDASQTNTLKEGEILRVPFEGELASSTLWPEIEKVFGHGYESVSLAVSSSRRLMATSCKATTAEHAVVRVYETETWKLVGQPLEGHNLTVTRIAFSPDDRFVLSVSRDRSWRLYEVQHDSGYLPIAADKSHGRIIWDCSWAHEGDAFATASRDKTVRIWTPASDGVNTKWVASAILKTKEPATAVAFAPAHTHDRRRLAVGLETGEISIYSSELASPSEWRLESTFNSKLAHVNHVHRLAWRPTSESGSTQLASCSEDGTLKILIVHAQLD